jgi:hypothetical protein
MASFSIPWFVAQRFHGDLEIPFHPLVIGHQTCLSTRSVARAGNWETEPSGSGDTSIYYTAPSGSPGTFPDGYSGIEKGGGCFITTAASP